MADSPNATEADERRLYILEENQTNAQNALQLAASKGQDLRDVVVVILDAREVLGSDYMQAVTPHQREEAEESARLGQTPILTTYKDRATAIAAFRTGAPSVATQLETEPPEGHFWICVMASGGVSVFARELDSRKAVGNA